MTDTYRFEGGDLRRDCCSCSECPQCLGSGELDLHDAEAILAGIHLLREMDVWPELLDAMEHHAKQQVRPLPESAWIRGLEARIALLERRLEGMARDALALTTHLSTHYPELRGLPSIAETERKAEHLLGRRLKVLA